jgi:hypothetical protein
MDSTMDFDVPRKLALLLLATHCRERRSGGRLLSF